MARDPSVALTLPPPTLPGTSHQVCGTACAQDGNEFHLIGPLNLLACCIEILVLGHPQQASEGEQGDKGQPLSNCQVDILCFILSLIRSSLFPSG